MVFLAISEEQDEARVARAHRPLLPRAAAGQPVRRPGDAAGRAAGAPDHRRRAASPARSRLRSSRPARPRSQPRARRPPDTATPPAAGGVLTAARRTPLSDTRRCCGMPTSGARPMRNQFKGTINIDIRDSVPDWAPFQPPQAPAGSPNVVYIVLDDVGFSAMSTYGGPIETPNIDRIAAAGVRYTQWHTTALCSPTRSCLLTGRNHTRNSMACITEGADRVPERQRHHPAGERHDLPDPRRAGLEHLRCGQVASDPRGRVQRGLAAAELAERAGIRAVLRLPGRRDQPVVSGPGLRQPSHRPAVLARGWLPPDRRPDRPGDRVHRGRQDHRPGQAVPPLLCAWRMPRAASGSEELDREVQGPVRPGLRGACGSRLSRGRRSWGSCPAIPSCRRSTRSERLETHTDPGKRMPELELTRPWDSLSCRRKAAVLPDGRGVCRVPGPHRLPHRPAA